MSRIKVGDLVRCISAYGGNNSVLQEVGIVSGCEKGMSLVEFFSNVEGHGGVGDFKAVYGHGWWVKDEFLIPAAMSEISLSSLVSYAIDGGEKNLDLLRSRLEN